MYYILSKEDILKHISTIAMASGVYEINEYFDIVKGYRTNLKQRYKDIYVPHRGVNIVSDFSTTEQLINRFEGQDTEGYYKTYATPFEDEELNYQQRLAKDSIEKLVDYWSGHWLFYALFHTIFFAKSEKNAGGSSSNLIGVLWLNIPNNYSLDDTVEFIIHETAHQLTFIDEMIYGGHYDYEKILSKDFFATSAIIKSSRPADKVFHSIVVAHTILFYRKETNKMFDTRIHGSYSDLLYNSLLSSKELLKIDNESRILTDRGRYITNKCHNSLLTLQYN